MNSLAEALGMQLPGSASIPAPYRERSQISYDVGERIVDMVFDDLKPADVMTPAKPSKMPLWSARLSAGPPTRLFISMPSPVIWVLNFLIRIGILSDMISLC